MPFSCYLLQDIDCLGKLICQECHYLPLPTVFKVSDFLSFCLSSFLFFSISFPQGISPKVEFSTTSVIEECDMKSSQPAVSVSLFPTSVFIPLIKWTISQLKELIRNSLLLFQIQLLCQIIITFCIMLMLVSRD